MHSTLSALFSQGEYQHCIDILLYNKYNTHPYYHCLYALCKYKLNEIGIAMQYLENQLYRQPNYYLYCVLGYIQRREKMYVPSLINFIKAISLPSQMEDTPFALNNISILKMNQSISFPQLTTLSIWKQFLDLVEINESPFTAYQLIQKEQWNTYFYHYLALSYCGNSEKLLEFCNLGKQYCSSNEYLFWDYLKLFAHNRSTIAQATPIVNHLILKNQIPLFVIYEIVFYFVKQNELERGESLLFLKFDKQKLLTWNSIKFQILYIKLLIKKNNLANTKMALLKIQQVMNSTNYDILKLLQCKCLYKMGNIHEFNSLIFQQQDEMITMELKWKKIKLACKQSLSCMNILQMEQRLSQMEKLSNTITQQQQQQSEKYKIQYYCHQCNYLFYLKKDVSSAFHIWYNHLQQVDQKLDFIIPLYYYNQIPSFSTFFYWKELAEYWIERGQIHLGIQALKYTTLSFRFVRLDLIFPILKLYFLIKEFDLMEPIVKKVISTISQQQQYLPMFIQIYLNAIFYQQYQMDWILKSALTEFEKNRFLEEMIKQLSVEQLYSIIRQYSPQQCQTIIEYLYQHKLYESEADHLYLLQQRMQYHSETKIEYQFYTSQPLQVEKMIHWPSQNYYHYSLCAKMESQPLIFEELFTIFQKIKDYNSITWEYLNQIQIQYKTIFDFLYTPISWLNNTNTNTKIYNSVMSLNGIIECLYLLLQNNDDSNLSFHLPVKEQQFPFLLVQMNYFLLKNEIYFEKNSNYDTVFEVNTIHLHPLIQFLCQCDSTIILFEKEEQIIYDIKLYEWLEQIVRDVFFQLMMIYYSGYQVNTREFIKIYYIQQNCKVHIPFEPLLDGNNNNNNNWIPTHCREWIRKLNQFVTIQKQEEEKSIIYNCMQSFQNMYITFKEEYITLQYLYTRIFYERRVEKEEKVNNVVITTTEEEEEQMEHRIDPYLIKILKRKLKLQKKFIQDDQQQQQQQQHSYNYDITENNNVEEEGIYNESREKKQQNLESFIENYYKILQNKQLLTIVSNV